MPNVEDDDDYDSSYFPPRGCENCVNGYRCEPSSFDSCECFPGKPDTYFCNYKRWDIETTNFTQIYPNAEFPNRLGVRYTGIAR